MQTAFNHYKKILCRILNLNDISEISSQDQCGFNGAVGACIVLEFIQNGETNFNTLASTFGAREDQISKPFMRLKKAGVFSDEFNLRKDPDYNLIFDIYSRDMEASRKDEIIRCWGHICSIASGYATV